jgi:hypothetical protein
MKILFIEYNADSVTDSEQPIPSTWKRRLNEKQQIPIEEPKHVEFLKQFYKILNQNRRE